MRLSEDRKPTYTPLAGDIVRADASQPEVTNQGTFTQTIDLCHINERSMVLPELLQIQINVTMLCMRLGTTKRRHIMSRSRAGGTS
mmetsp:Transcript_101123/g.324851  ORF Transcript_101123/g.324851 Transcript_101123/m.324851 type:complete len:86 (-) Transcript_101123:1016-1273(-)